MGPKTLITGNSILPFQFGNFFHLTNGIKFQPATWKNSLARNYLLTQNLDVLKAALMLQSDHYIKTTKPNSNYPSADKHLYGVLALIHQESHRFINDQTADEVLDTVLKDLVENKFGIPPSKYFISSLMTFPQIIPLF